MGRTIANTRSVSGACCSLRIACSSAFARVPGKSSPVHFFWGSCDLAVTRFSGRRAPPHPGGVPNLPLAVAQEAYSHEVSSAGFWPGGPALPEPAFYAYAYPEPPGFRDAKLKPSAAFYKQELGRVHLALRGRALCPRPGANAARLLADELRSCRRRGRLGARGARVRARSAGCSAPLAAPHSAHVSSAAEARALPRS